MMQSSSITKRFLLIFVPLCVAATAIAFAIYVADTNANRKALEQSELRIVRLEKNSLNKDFKMIIKELDHLATSPELQEFLADPQAFHRKEHLQEYLLLLSIFTDLFDQVRYLDENGLEVVRVNYNNDRPAVVLEGQLQPKAGRYYFDAAIRLDEGEVYISPLDLNIENGQIEQPLKPMIRFARPVFDQSGQKRGVVVLNYFGARMLANAVKVAAPDQLAQFMLLNSDGYWLKGVTPADEWGFMFDDRLDATFANRYSEAWQQISAADSGQLYTGAGLFTFDTLYPLEAGQQSSSEVAAAFAPSAETRDATGYYWKIVSYIPQATLGGQRAGFIRNLATVYLALIALIAVFSYVLAKIMHTQQQTAQNLRRSEITYQRLVETINDGVWVLNTDAATNYANETMAAMLGYTVDELIDRPLFDFVAPDGQPVIANSIRNLQPGVVQQHDLKLHHKNGRDLWVLLKIGLLIDENDQQTGILTTVTDITRRKEDEETLRLQTRAIEANPNPIMILDAQAPEKPLIYVNSAFEHVTGYPAAEVLGQNTRFLRNGDETQWATQQLDVALSEGREYTATLRNYRKNGDLFWNEIRVAPVYNDKGVLSHFVEVINDVTHRIQAEAEIRLAKEAAEAANKAKSEFLASMSHELRTPLTSVLGLSEVLQIQAYGELNDMQLRAIDTIAGSGQHLLNLINDILDLSKIEAGKLDLFPESCDLADICQSSLQLTKGMAHQKQQRVEFSMNPMVITLTADGRRLKQMLVNLLSNAIKFTPEGGELGLEVTGNVDDELVYLAVWDKGIGIEPEDMARLFKPFTQLDSSLDRKHSGTGLGLSLVRQMAELHGGSIQLESVPNQGSRFTIILPWSAPQAAPLPDLAIDDVDASHLQTGLVIEDNPLDAELVSHYLQQLGLTSIVQSTATGALEEAATQRPGVILLDLHLPDGSGLEVLTQLKADERTRDIPVIINSVAEQCTKAMQLGAAGYLVKPVKQQDLQAALAKVVAANHSASPVMVIASPNTTGPKVMLTDDNETILQTVSDYLLAKGYRVTTSCSGFELLERVDKVRPDIILTDIQMPGMDGMEAIRRLRAHSNPAIANTPIIAVTALAMTGDREKCLQAGANEYLSKPIVLTQLNRQIRQLLKKDNNPLLQFTPAMPSAAKLT